LNLIADLNSYGVIYTILTLIICISTSHVICKLNKYEYDSRSKNRLGCIDGLRGYLALGVFFHHFVVFYIYIVKGYWCIPPSRFFTNLGQTGPVLFFMITGFLFFHRILNKRMGFRWTNLFISRFFRLVPLYWTCVAVITVIVFINTGQFNSSAFEIIVDILYWLSFFGTPDINNFPLTWIIIAGGTWTLKYEWVFYFSLPFLSIIIRPSTYLKLLMSFIILTTAYYTIRPITISSVDIESQFFSLFFLGALSAYLNQFKFIKKKITSPIFSIIGIGSLAYLLFFFDTSIGYIQYILLYIFFLPVSLGNSMFGLLNKNFSILLGEISYSIYLIHGLILYVTFTILYPNVFENIIVSFRFFSWMVLICLATIIISWLTYILIERTFIKLGKSLQSQVS